MAKSPKKKPRKKPFKQGPKGGRKHTPGKDHNTKSGSAKRKRFAKKKRRERAEQQEDCRQQWATWDALSDDAKKLRPDLTPNCPRPTDDDKPADS
jgi:hypothetical protein